MNKPENITRETEEKVSRWITAEKNLEECKRMVSSAECEVANATNDLGKFLTPEDAIKGEYFNIWYGNGLIAIVKDDHHKFKITWRKKPTGGV